jgi:peptidoglycan biosynthesis protein MviN/MurJ (putative lipid II flippase)
LAFLLTEFLNLMLLLYVIFRFDLLPKTRFNIRKALSITVFKESKPLLKLIIPAIFSIAKR